jgi:hypothetical protein
MASVGAASAMRPVASPPSPVALRVRDCLFDHLMASTRGFGQDCLFERQRSRSQFFATRNCLEQDRGRSGQAFSVVRSLDQRFNRDEKTFQTVRFPYEIC